ncbi:MAG: peptidase C13 [Alphaproteobacteria bacterium]|nr:peptidase C13 [Alphaproteobacteria bacterium]
MQVVLARIVLAGLALAALFALPPASMAFNANFSGWAVLVVAGDWRANTGNPTQGFENARREMAASFASLGFLPANIRQLSVKPPPGEQGVGLAVGPKSLETTFLPATMRAPSGCLIYITSHGSEEGVVLGDTLMTPSQMQRFLRTTCGERPTILIVSACHSGIFAKPELQAPNRMIFTAALPERSSFGCGETDRYPYFDGCMLDTLRDGAGSFLDLAQKTMKCVTRRERELRALPSEPQLFVGARIRPLLEALRFDLAAIEDGKADAPRYALR